MPTNAPASVNKRVLAGEPALIIGAVAALIVALCGIFGIIIDLNTVQVALLALVPIVQAILTRFNVSPVVKGNEGV